MLTADLVDARRKDGALHLRTLDDEGKEVALAMGAAYLEAARASVGKPRAELTEAWEAIGADAAPKWFKLLGGLRKLAEDACTFEAETLVDPTALRRALFTRASAHRRTRAEGAPFDRASVIAETGAELGLEADVVERAMFSDLRSEHLLRVAPIQDAEHLLDEWQLGQAQAVLLTAVKVTCEVRASSPGLVRAFFAKLKFHRLLFAAEQIEEGWRVTIDGPYSMFDSVTKYGLRLALILPALRTLEHWSLVADIRWGKQREPLAFRLESEARSAAASETVHLADEVAELVQAIEALESGWKVKVSTKLLDVPGLGVCIPDLELIPPKGDRKSAVFVEVLGYWSRDAVFRRVELAEKGLGERIVFAVSSRLRVSPEVLPEELPASLYVYKGKMSPRAILEHAAASQKRRRR